MRTYYNEIDPKTCAWLRELMAADLIPAGDVDERSIVDVRADELRGYGACHFFAGIGGWAYALRLAGWPEDREVWTGSCPCQSLSCAGLGKGHADERHLWPAFYRLIAECRPSAVFGEQVASKDGREWLAGIRADLEGVGYAVGSADLCSAGCGAPNIRQRLYWLADPKHTKRRTQHKHGEDGRNRQDDGRQETHREPGARGEVQRLAESSLLRDGRRILGPGESDCAIEKRASEEFAGCGANGGLGDAEIDGSRPLDWQSDSSRGRSQQDRRSGLPLRMGESVRTGSQGHAGNGDDGHESRRERTSTAGSTAENGNAGGMGDPLRRGQQESPERNSKSKQDSAVGDSRRTDIDRPNFWAGAIWHPCRDGRARRIAVEPEIFPLVAGLPGRVGLLRGAGNAINPEVAAQFIRAYLEI